MFQATNEVFLCHSSVDLLAYVKPVAKELENNGISFWLDDDEDILGGRVQDILSALSQSKCVLAFLSEDFLGNASAEDELKLALKLSEEHVLLLIPLFICERRIAIKHYPPLTDVIGIDWNQGIPKIVARLKGKLQKMMDEPEIPEEPRAVQYSTEQLRSSFQAASPSSDKSLFREAVNHIGMFNQVSSDPTQMQYPMVTMLANRFALLILRHYKIKIGKDSLPNAFLIFFNLVLQKVTTGNWALPASLADLVSDFEEDILNHRNLHLEQLLSELQVLTKLEERGQDVVGIDGTQVQDALDQLSKTALKLLSIDDNEQVRWIRNLCAEGEGEYIEYKSSFRYNLKEQTKDKTLQEVAIREITAFLNADGGTLLIGVDDDGAIVGLENDYSTFRDKAHGEHDLLLRAFSTAVGNSIGTPTVASYVKSNIFKVDGMDVMIITVKRGQRPVFYVEKKDGGPIVHFMVRVGASMRSLNVKEAIEYTQDRF